MQREAGRKESELEQLHALACDFIRRALCDDAPFLFTPQQLALAGLAEAGSHPSTPGDDGFASISAGGDDSAPQLRSLSADDSETAGGPTAGGPAYCSLASGGDAGGAGG